MMKWTMAQTEQLFLLATAFLLLGKGCGDSLCDSNQVQCKLGTTCIGVQYVCDGRLHCPDGSDEESSLCSIWNFDRNSCSRSNAYCASNCYSYIDFCSRESCASTLHKKVCKIIKEKTLNIKEESGMVLTDEAMDLLSSAVNSSMNQKLPECPMLYTRVGNECLAFFSLARVPWPEARQFCKSIFGDLVSFSTLHEFAHISDYLKEALLTSDFWIGGRFDMDQNSWSWVSDDTSMPLGTPYWAMSYNSSCVRRPPPHTDPSSDPPAALPDAPCYNYVQRPIKRQQGWCSAMTYEHFYYISDESCQEARSPLCLLTRQPQV